MATVAAVEGDSDSDAESGARGEGEGEARGDEEMAAEGGAEKRLILPSVSRRRA